MCCVSIDLWQIMQYLQFSYNFHDIFAKLHYYKVSFPFFCAIPFVVDCCNLKINVHCSQMSLMQLDKYHQKRCLRHGNRTHRLHINSLYVRDTIRSQHLILTNNSYFSGRNAFFHLGLYNKVLSGHFIQQTFIGHYLALNEAQNKRK